MAWRYDIGLLRQLCLEFKQQVAVPLLVSLKVFKKLLRMTDLSLQLYNNFFCLFLRLFFGALLFLLSRFLYSLYFLTLGLPFGYFVFEQFFLLFELDNAYLHPVDGFLQRLFLFIALLLYLLFLPHYLLFLYNTPLFLLLPGLFFLTPRVPFFIYSFKDFLKSDLIDLLYSLFLLLQPIHLLFPALQLFFLAHVEAINCLLCLFLSLSIPSSHFISFSCQAFS